VNYNRLCFKWLGEIANEMDARKERRFRSHRVEKRESKRTRALNAFLDARSNLCYTESNVEQDHNFDGNGRRAFHGSGERCRAIVHPLQHAKSKSLPGKLLR
jgi:hypothetical protein